MNTKQKLTFLAALVLASGAAYAMIADTKTPASTKAATSTSGASASATREEIAKAEAMSVERFRKIIEYRGNTPIVADYCLVNPSWTLAEHEMDCSLTRFRGYHEIYTAGWKVATVVSGGAGVELVFIERIGAGQ